MEELSTNEKGAIAESAIRHAAARCRVGIYHPLSSHSRADLVLEIGATLYRVQVKWGRVDPSGDVIIARVGGNYLTAHGYVRSSYSEDEIDLLAIYCGDLDRCFLLPISMVAGMQALQLRLTRPATISRHVLTLQTNSLSKGL